jgi:hypothetical protein
MIRQGTGCLVSSDKALQGSGIWAMNVWSSLYPITQIFQPQLGLSVGKLLMGRAVKILWQSAIKRKAQLL